MNIGAFKKTSLIEVPDHISTVVFVNGCNFKCGFCYNGWLLKNSVTIPENEIFDFLERRKNQVEYVAVTGGEPTLQKDLSEFLQKAKNYGFKTALETNGSNPRMVKDLLKKNILDYLAMDIKTDMQHYNTFFEKPESIENSIEIILDSNINYEFRTTMVPAYVDKIKFRNILETIDSAKNYYLQKFKPEETLDSALKDSKLYTEKEFKEFKRMADVHVENCQLRL